MIAQRPMQTVSNAVTIKPLAKTAAKASTKYLPPETASALTVRSIPTMFRDPTMDQEPATLAQIR